MTATGNFTNDYLYLPYLAAYVICAYLSVVFICHLLFDTKDYSLLAPHKYKKRYKKKRCIAPAQIASDCLRCCCPCCLCDDYHCCGITLPLFIAETLSDSSYLYGIAGRFALLFTRIISFLFLIYYVVLSYNTSDNSRELNKFSAWNNIGAAFVFFFLLLSSFVGLVRRIREGELQQQQQQHGQAGSKWPIIVQRGALLLHYSYECMFGNAIFITIMEYLYQQQFEDNRQFDVTFTNTKQHLIPTGFFIFDSFLNIIPVRLEHYYVCLSLPIAYLIFQWVSVTTGSVDWQYTFLQTNRARCFGKYSILFAIHVACFVAVVVLMSVRDKIMTISYDQRYRLLRSESDEFDVANRNEDDPESNIEFSDVYASNDQGMFIGSFEDINEGDEEASLPSAPPSFHGLAHPPLPVLPSNTLPPMATIDLPMALPVYEGSTPSRV